MGGNSVDPELVEEEEEPQQVGEFPDRVPANPSNLPSFYTPWGEAVGLDKGWRPGTTLKLGDHERTWILKRGEYDTIRWVCRLKDPNEPIEYEKIHFEHIIEGSNVLEILKKLVELHSRPGYRWSTYHGRSFHQERETAETIQDGLLVLAYSKMSIPLKKFDFDSMNCEKYDLSISGRELYALLLQHPMTGEELMVYVYKTPSTDEWKASLRMPRAPGKRKPTVGDQLRNRVSALVHAVAVEARMSGWSHVYSSTSLRVGTIPDSLDRIAEALKFLQNFKSWPRILKRLRTQIVDVLKSLENRMVVRRHPNARFAEAFLCRLVGMKLKRITPIKSPTLAEAANELPST